MRQRFGGGFRVGARGCAPMPKPPFLQPTPPSFRAIIWSRRHWLRRPRAIWPLSRRCWPQSVTLSATRRGARAFPCLRRRALAITSPSAEPDPVDARRGLSLDAVAKLSGVSRSMVSQIERGESSPTVATLWNLTQALQIDFAGLLEGRTAPGIEVVRAEAAPVIGGRGQGLTIRILSPAEDVGEN